MRIELILLPTTDVDRSKQFYVDQVGFVLDHDVEPGNGMRVVQLTPPGSACSIGFGVGMIAPDAPPVSGIHLVVDDLDGVRGSLLDQGVDVSGTQDMGGGVRYAYFNDPDGNSWALQEIAARGVL
jgi:predicted enzyme related to lactoylglutathione lyase